MKLNEKTKNTLSFVGRIVFSGALLVYLFKNIDMAKTANVIKTADPMYIFYAFLLTLVINGFMLLRWFILIRALDLNVSVLSVVRYYFIGLFGNLFLPSSIGGDLIKILGLCQQSSQKARVVASVLLDRMSGFAAIVIVAVIAFTFGFKLIGDFLLLIMIAGLAVLSMGVALVLFNGKIYAFGCSVFNKLPKVKDSLMNLHYDVMLLKNRQMRGWAAIGISCLSQGLLSFVFYLTAKAFHQDINILYFLIFVPLICVASSFPSIGGLGVREYGAKHLFAMIGVESGISVSMSLVNFLFMVIIGMIGGLVYVSTLSAGRVQHHSPGPEISPHKV